MTLVQLPSVADLAVRLGVPVEAILGEDLGRAEAAIEDGTNPRSRRGSGRARGALAGRRDRPAACPPRDPSRGSSRVGQPSRPVL